MNMKITSMCNAVGKYKGQYKQTGLLLADVEGAETWVNIEGQLNYQDYKDKQVTVDIRQNAKGYWAGTLVGGQQNTQQGTSQPRQGQQPDTSRDLAIKRGNALNAVFSATTIPSDLVGDYLQASLRWLIF